MGDPDTCPSAVETAVKPLQEIVTTSVEVFLRSFIPLVIPAFFSFLVFAVVDLFFTALIGGNRGSFHPSWIWIKYLMMGIVGIGCGGTAIGMNALVVLTDSSKKLLGISEVVGGALKKVGSLFSGTLLYHIVVLVPAIPGLFFLWLVLYFSFYQQLLYAVGCLLAAGLLLYYPMKLFLQMILFGFTIMKEGEKGWSSLLRSRQLMRMPAHGGITANSMFRAIVLLHVSLVPSIVILLMTLIPFIVLCFIYPMESLMTDIKGETLNVAYAVLQVVNAMVMALIVPIFVVPLAILYRDIKKRTAC